LTFFEKGEILILKSSIDVCGKGGRLQMKTTKNESGRASLSRIKLLLILITGALLTVSCGGGGYGGGGGMVAAPGAFSLSMPTNGAMGVTTAPTLSWTASPYATEYEVQINTMSTFAGTMVNDTKNLATTSYMVSPALAPGTYFWRVIASSTYGTYTAGPFSFTT
jgi:hypothetical protein